MDCTVVICTHNRAESLRCLLEALVRQRYEHGRLEILIVDNASTDHTREVAESFAQKDSRVRYLSEPKLGLSRARNTGVQAAHGEVVVFVDDDAVPRDLDWAQNLADAYRDPSVAVAGGDVEIEWPEGACPEWLHEALLPCLGQTRFAHREPTSLHYPVCPWGANISFRREPLLSVAPFSTDLGLVGAQQQLGEEIEVCLRLERAGWKIVYVPGASVSHFIGADRLNEPFFHERALGQGKSRATIDARHFSIPRRAAKCVVRSVDLALQLGALGFFHLCGDRRRRLRSQYRMRFSASYLAQAWRS